MYQESVTTMSFSLRVQGGGTVDSTSNLTSLAQQCSSLSKPQHSGSLYGSGDLSSTVSLSARPSLRAAGKLRTAGALRIKGPGVARFSPRTQALQRLAARGEAVLPSASRIKSKCMNSGNRYTAPQLHATRSAVAEADSSDGTASSGCSREFASAPIEVVTPSSSANPMNTPLPCVPALPIPASAAVHSSTPLEPPCEGDITGGEATQGNKTNALVPSPRPRTRTPRSLAQRLPSTVPEDDMVKGTSDVLLDASSVLPWPSGVSGWSGSTVTAPTAMHASKYEVLETGVLTSVQTDFSGSELSASKYEVLVDSVFNTLDGSDTTLTSIRSGKVTPCVTSPPDSEGVQSRALVHMNGSSETEMAFLLPNSAFAGEPGSMKGDSGKRGGHNKAVMKVWAGMGLFGESSEASVEMLGQVVAQTQQ